MEAEIKTIPSLSTADNPVYLVIKLNDFGPIVDYLGTDTMGKDTVYDEFSVSCTANSQSIMFLFEHSKDLSKGKYLLSGKILPEKGGVATGTTYIYIQPKSVIFCN